MIKTTKLGPYRGYVGRSWYCKPNSNAGYSDFTRVLVTNMGYPRGSGLLGRASESEINEKFRRIVDGCLASYTETDVNPPPHLDHEIGRKGEPYNWEDV